MIDRIAPTQRPEGRPQGFQRWRNLLFLHWEVPVEALRPLIPEALSIDTWEGKAYVGVVPFTMRDVAPAWAPPVPGISNFHELNVRTYVHYKGQNPGVWFFSLDAAGTVAVLAARAGWDLPYHRATMDLTIEGDEVNYTSERLFPGPKPAELKVRYQIGDHLGPTEPNTLRHFLAERYILYASDGEHIRMGRVHHVPYPLQRATVLQLSQTMIQVQGLPEPQVPPTALYSEGVDVDIYGLDIIEQ
ncbi:MAG: DUF2071 domain-containing protein [Polyangiaceae bacterium]|nr:DUF2071 domain-containing protein [Polyangiaceae bacterium]